MKQVYGDRVRPLCDKTVKEDLSTYAEQVERLREQRYAIVLVKYVKQRRVGVRSDVHTRQHVETATEWTDGEPAGGGCCHVAFAGQLQRRERVQVKADGGLGRTIKDIDPERNL